MQIKPIPVDIDINAEERIKHMFTEGVVKGELIACVFVAMRRVVVDMPGAHAAVTMTDKGISLILDTKFSKTCTKAEFYLTLNHELEHITSLHFIRAEEMADNLGISIQEFYANYTWAADMPVNWAIKELPSFNGDSMVTYDSIAKQFPKDPPSYDKHATFELVIDWLRKNKDYKKPPPDITTILVDDDGNVTQTINPGGENIVVVPKIDKNSNKENMEDMKDIIENALKSAGQGSSDMAKSLASFLDELEEMAERGYALLKRFLTGKRSVPNERKRSFRRLNRRTGMLPGKRKGDGYSAMFIVDESGSMSDEEVASALALAKSLVLRTGHDKIYLVHWDSEPSTEVELIKTFSDIEHIERKKTGGTEFNDLFTHELILKYDVDIHIIITDGYPCGWPIGRTNIPHCWIITQSGGYKEWKRDYNKGFAVDVSII